MELRHLRYFVAVAEELHFRRAAEKLHIAQPALSKQVSALEHELGVRLLERDRRGVTLTEAGRVFLAEAVEVLARAGNAVDRARAVVRGEVGRLAIGFIQPALADLLPRSLRVFRRHYPGVVLTLSETTTRTALEGVADRSIHLAFVRLPITPRPDLRTELVSEEPVQLVVPRGHRFAGRPSVRLEEIADEELVLLDRSVEPMLHDYYVTACNRAGFSPRVAHEVSSTSIAIGLVAGGLGIAFVPASARFAAQPTVAHVPLEDAGLTLTMGAMWRAGPQPAALANFLALRPWEDGAPR
ncbi:LysR substrate-binding domain-containing protein [Geodermatophilus sp. CPCC 206100]|uniref:LysR substrate-binding domain-containing protein n=1 Tax=Geodermatophilus sp. CPCC 206100 TaxID=3020054 RepID=UPI003B0033A5